MAFNTISTTAVGNLGGDPELRYTQSGKAVASASLAVDTGWYDKNAGNSGAWHEQTTWIKLTWWGDAAGYVSEKLHKGDTLIITGTPKAEAYKTDDGELRSSLVLTVDSHKVLKRAGGSNGGGQRGPLSAEEVDKQGYDPNDLNDIPF